MSKLVKLEYEPHHAEYGKGAEDYHFYCPGCEQVHQIRAKGPEPRWTFNGDLDKPTFSPSYLLTSDYGTDRKKRVCHSFIRDGKIQFLGDCTHKLAGKTVEIPDKWG